MWLNRITDFGLPGPDRDLVNEMRMTRAIMMGRAFLQEIDPMPVVAKSRRRSRSSVQPGGYDEHRLALQGRATLALTPDHELD